jgi:hypothetical protein
MWPVLCNWSQLGLVLCWYPWLAHCTPLHWGVAHGAMGSFAGLEADTKHWQKQTGYRPLCCWTHSLYLFVFFRALTVKHQNDS